jgi:uncharacterized SAM-binding protein YcdF (DUF218 family)
MNTRTIQNAPWPARRRLPGRSARILLGGAGWLFIVQLTIGFTGLPRPLTLWLAGGKPPVSHDVRHVIVLGGAGIPSESGLMRTYRAAGFVAGSTGMTCVVALPCDVAPDTGSVGRMRDELVLRGVPRASILMEYRGLNTHEQALNIRELLGPEALDAPVVVVTSPTHVRRALLCFRKAGFRNVTGLPAHSADVEADIGPHGLWRYGFWSNLENQFTVARELLALLQYKVKGWI